MIYGGRLGTNLVELEYLDIETLGAVLSEQMRYPQATIAEFEAVTSATLATIPAALIEKHYVFPLSVDGRKLKVAMASPFDIFREQPAVLIGILTILVIYVTMVYGPIAAALVELFPTRIRYTSMSLPYHIGNGWFGGLLPATAFAISAQSGNIYAGLWYAIVVAVMTVIIGAIFVPGGTQNKSMFTDDPEHKMHR